MIPTLPDNPDALPGAARDAVKAALPGVPELSRLPRYVDRRTGAALLTQHFFPASHRSLEVWPLTWRHVNGRALVETAELFAVAQSKLDAAPAIRGGRRPAQQAA